MADVNVSSRSNDCAGKSSPCTFFLTMVIITISLLIKKQPSRIHAKLCTQRKSVKTHTAYALSKDATMRRRNWGVVAG